MADGNVIDSLSIELSASVDKSISAVDDLQQKLTKLSGALENFTDGGKYIGAINNLANGFKTLESSLSGDLASNVGDIAKSLKTLSVASDKVGESFKTMTKYPQTLKQRVGSALGDVFNEFGIKGEANIDKVSQSFVELDAAMWERNGERSLAQQNEAYKNTIQMIQELSDVAREGTDAYHGLLDAVHEYLKSGTKVHIKEGSGREYRDGELLGMISTMGGSRHFTTGKGDVDFQEFAHEINKKIGNLIPEEIDNEGGSYISLRAFADAMAAARKEADELANGGSKITFSYKEVSKAVYDSLEKVKNAVETFDDTGVEEVASPFERLAPTLKQFEGLKFPDFTQLSTLGTAIQKISQGGDTAVSNLPMIADSVKTLYSSFEGATIPDFTQISVLGTAISKLGSENAKNASTVLPNITAELESFATHFKDISIDNGSLDTIQKLGSAFSKLGGKNANEAIAVLPQMGDAIRNIVEDLNSLPEVSDKTVQLVTALGNLAKANTSVGKSMESLNGYSGKTKSVFEGLKVAVKGVATSVKSELVSSFKQGYQASLTLGNGMKAASGHAQSLTMAIVKIRTLFWGLRQLASFFSGAIENASSLTEVQNVIQHVYDPSYLETFNKASENTIQTLGMSKLSFQTFASRYQAMGKAMGITNSQMQAAESHLQGMGIEYGTASGKMADMSLNLTQLAADMASFYDVDVSDVYTSLQAIYTGQTRPLRQYGRILYAA